VIRFGVRQIGIALLAVSLNPSAQAYRVGIVVDIQNRPDIRHYEYTIWDGVEDAYICATQTQVRIHLKEKVKYRFRGKSVLIIDDDGIEQEATEVAQEEMVPTRRFKLPRGFPHW
jgi:hypothetical protein